MFVLNLNVFVALLILAIYLTSWLLGIPLSMLIIPRDGSLLMLELIILSLGFILVFIWAKKGLVRSAGFFRYLKAYQIGHWILATANIILIGGIGFFLRAASLSKEDEYWFGLIMTSVIGPIGGVLASAGLAMVLLIPRRRYPEN